jgi:hypothetical protein
MYSLLDRTETFAHAHLGSFTRWLDRIIFLTAVTIVKCQRRSAGLFRVRCLQKRLTVQPIRPAPPIQQGLMRCCGSLAYPDRDISR